MEEINHFSHEEHPLKLIENWETVAASVFTDDDDDDDVKKKDVIECHGCGDPISILGGSVYGCVPCQYFLHKICAELKSSINHHFHPLHPLILTTNRGIWNCNVCGKKDQEKCYSYWCSECDFDACIKCGGVVALMEGLLMKLKHEGHHPQHTLTLQSRFGSFDCNACHTNKQDYFYKCDNCDFWIHNACASLGPTIKLPHHHHPLHLVYSLPESFHRFYFNCEFCEKYILKNDIWLYHCANCRYFAHIKCALDAEHLPISSDVPGSSSLDEDRGNGLLQFPMAYAFTDPLKLLHSENIRQDNDDEIEINHWSHDHPLILIDDADSQGNIINFGGDSDVIEVCYGCVRPLSFPYYTCKLDGCLFSLHKYCAQLPFTLEKHHLHPHHLLHLKDNDEYTCDGCYSWGNTFSYQCKTCNFVLDVNCAFLPENIKHKSHNHSLTQVNKDPKLVCEACSRRMDVGSSYSCKACNFHLCLFCATRCPTSIGHRYCKGHDVILTYPPVEDHPEDFYCEICEKEMHPKQHSLYYCQKCKNSFHLRCLTPVNIFLNVWKVGTRTESHHKHPLTFVRRKKTPDYVCSKCNVDINGRLILECRSKACNFNICCECKLKTYNN